MSVARWALGGAVVGAGVMYLVDPFSGRRRRARAHDKALHAAHQAEHAAGMVAHDMAHRSRGLLYEWVARLRSEEQLDDATLEARVRAALGRVCSHPGAVKVVARSGRVRLEGPILASELPRTLARLRRVRGVYVLESALEPHEQAGHHPDLQGGVLRTGDRPELLQHHWAPSTRFLAGLGGTGLVLWGTRRGGMIGQGAAVAGVLLGLRALTNLEVRRLTGVGAGRRAIELHKDITVQAPIEEVFAFWQAMENFPRFMSHIKEVRVGSEGRSHWKVQGPAGLSFEWDAVITRLIPHRVLAWKSVQGALVGNAGVIHFEPMQGGRATRLDIRLSYNPPAGAVGHAFARLLGADPKKEMDDDLLRFKTLLERGRATAHGKTVTREELEPQQASRPEQEEPTRH